MASAVIFDLDGTLLDTLPDIASATNQVLREFGYPAVPQGQFGNLVGEGAEVLLQRAFLTSAQRDLSEPEAVRALAKYREYYEAQGDALARPFDGIHALLRELQARGARMAVLSNKRDDFVKRLVGKHFADIHFREVRGHRAGVPLKPEPTSTYEVALTLNVSCSHITFVGDTSVDRAVAQSAGTKFMGVAWGFRPHELQGAVVARDAVHARTLLLGRL